MCAILKERLAIIAVANCSAHNQGIADSTVMRTVHLHIGNIVTVHWLMVACKQVFLVHSKREFHRLVTHCSIWQPGGTRHRQRAETPIST
jgi:hypothetical protein